MPRLVWPTVAHVIFHLLQLLNVDAFFPLKKYLCMYSILCKVEDKLRFYLKKNVWKVAIYEKMSTFVFIPRTK